MKTKNFYISRLCQFAFITCCIGQPVFAAETEANTHNNHNTSQSAHGHATDAEQHAVTGPHSGEHSSDASNHDTNKSHSTSHDNLGGHSNGASNATSHSKTGHRQH